MPHIVVVEDDEANARLFLTVLQRLGGFDVTLTEDPERVIALSRAGQVDLVILDVSLSDSVMAGRPVSGIEISRLLKDDPRSAEVPVILMTAHAMSGDRERFLAESRADAYLAKPITDQPALIAQIEKLLRERIAESGGSQ